MRKFIHLFKRYLFSFVLVIVGIMVFIQFAELVLTKEAYLENYILDTVAGIEGLSNVSIENKENVVKALFVMEMNCETSSLLRQVYDANDAYKDQLRNQLFQIHKPKFDVYKELGIRQYQIHLRDAESFLRVHNPSVYGDDLTEIRRTVVDALESRVLVKGMEEGRFSNGYRYVFPIIEDNELLGSIEYSYSLKSMLKPVIDTYDLTSVFMVNKDEVDSKTFMSISRDYTTDIRFNDWYLDNSFSNENLEEKVLLNKGEFLLINNQVIENIQTGVFGVDAFVYEKFDDKLVWAMPFEVRDYTDRVLGYLIHYKNDDVLMDLVDQRDKQIRGSLSMILVSLILLSAIWKLYSVTRINAHHDSLTNLYNRHYFYNYITEKVKIGTILMIDIDDFKLINDKYGHDCGDKVLTALAKTLKDHVRSNDNVLRWGGEEFLVVLKDTPLKEGYNKACHLRKIIEETSFNDKKLTISIGVSKLRDDFESSIKEADQALYFVKEHGKNSVKIFERSMDS
ncbi:diguanylate cyclase [Acidaminobacter sp. JC074]|uniref:diguanylate cyclase n=1 Tax=Acidaminobacter sp. JC074 TaxID=2530199 RepID=UPI001F0FBF83|nr:diguanylate cyclase [Acidaminobacter sp. JC074]MCH4888427.1 diguanylate cyclase [Acidaminobacter sp. JC074]